MKTTSKLELLLKRVKLSDAYTEGELYIDGEKFCDTIEDKVRDVNRNGILDNNEPKVYGQTAIPYGRYRITLSVQSPRFSKSPLYRFCNGFLPRLLDVPGFSGILIHIGNTAKDSHGCILVGIKIKDGFISKSTKTFKALYEVLKRNEDKDIYINIV